MTGSVETYTLRKPVRATCDSQREADGEEIWWWDIFMDGEEVGPSFSNDDFHELFVRVSVQKQELREQLKAIVRYAILETHPEELTMSDHDEITNATDKAVNKLLALVGSSQKETDTE